MWFLVLFVLVTGNDGATVNGTVTIAAPYATEKACKDDIEGVTTEFENWVKTRPELAGTRVTDAKCIQQH